MGFQFSISKSWAQWSGGGVGVRGKSKMNKEEGGLTMLGRVEVEGDKVRKMGSLFKFVVLQMEFLQEKRRFANNSYIYELNNHYVFGVW